MIILQNQEFLDVFHNKKRFVLVRTEDGQSLKEGDVIKIKGANDGPIMFRCITHVQVADALLKDDAKLLYLSLKPLTAAQKGAIK